MLDLVDPVDQRKLELVVTLAVSVRDSMLHKEMVDCVFILLTISQDEPSKLS